MSVTTATRPRTPAAPSIPLPPRPMGQRLAKEFPDAGKCAKTKAQLLATATTLERHSRAIASVLTISERHQLGDVVEILRRTARAFNVARVANEEEQGR